jgi:hypothetical protein
METRPRVRVMAWSVPRLLFMWSLAVQADQQVRRRRQLQSTPTSRHRVPSNNCASIRTRVEVVLLLHEPNNIRPSGYSGSLNDSSLFIFLFDSTPLLANLPHS